jgi:hypothetical protein
MKCNMKASAERQMFFYLRISILKQVQLSICLNDIKRGKTFKVKTDQFLFI